MATLAVDSKRDFELNVDPAYCDVPVIASDIIYEGAMVGESSSTGTARPLQAGDVFRGFAVRRADNSAGSASDINVRIRQRGVVRIPVTGVSGAADLGATVYASDDDTATLSSTNNSAIGKIVRWESGTTCLVYFEGAQVRSI